MTTEGIAFLLFLIGFGIAIISGKRWAYLTLLALLSAGLCGIGYEFRTDIFAFENSDTVSVMIMLLGSALLLTLIGLYVRFQVSLRLMLLKVGMAGIVMLLFLAPHLERVHASSQLQAVLAKKGLPAPHFHAGCICGVKWKGPLTDDEFTLIKYANPVNELSFEETELTAEQQAWFDNWKTSKPGRGHASK